MEFAHWHSTYEEAVGGLSQQTWQAGILKEIRRLAIKKGRVLDVGNHLNPVRQGPSKTLAGRSRSIYL